ncbi:MAG: 3-hydroxyacyl-ACP dehydratase FabZ [candidate division WOR-3 bacterium]
MIDIREIMNRLPHRYPFLLVDRITEMSEERIVAIKCVTINEPYFQGHFPGAPVMPGVLQIEALAQAGGALLFSKFPPEAREHKLVYFVAIDEVKFRRPVIPGDVLVLELELVRFGGRIIKMKGKARVGEEIACEGIFTATIVDR